MTPSESQLRANSHSSEEQPPAKPARDRRRSVSHPSSRDRCTEAEELGDAIAELSARIQVATYELLVLIHKFDECVGWNNGFRSCAHWLNWRTGLALGAAREKVRVARALAELPKLSAAMQKGQLSYSKVRALTRVATSANETKLLDFARCGTVADVECLSRGWRRMDRAAERDEDRRRHESRHLRTWIDDDGMVVIRGRLSPEVGAVVRRALEAAEERLHTRERDDGAAKSGAAVEVEERVESTPGQRRADALGLIAESALAAGLDSGTTGDRYQVVVHVDDAVLTDNDDGTGQSALEDADGLRVSAETSRRIGCDGSKVVVRQDKEGRVLDVGRKTRTIPPALRRALAARDRHCRFPGCHVRHCDAHHVRHWAGGGAIKLDNLLLLCRHLHRAVHEEGFTVNLGNDGDARFSWPAGRPFPKVPQPPRWPDDGDVLAPALDRLRRAGITIGPDTATSRRHGERLDLGWAIDVLWQPPGVPTEGRDVFAETRPEH